MRRLIKIALILIATIWSLSLALHAAPDYRNHQDADRLGREYAWKTFRETYPPEYTKTYCASHIRSMFRAHIAESLEILPDPPKMSRTAFTSYQASYFNLKEEFEGCRNYVSNTKQGQLFDSATTLDELREAFHRMDVVLAEGRTFFNTSNASDAKAPYFFEVLAELRRVLREKSQ